MERKTTKSTETMGINNNDPESKPTEKPSQLLPGIGITKAEWRQMSLMDKWRASYNQQYSDAGINSRAAMAGTLIMLYTAVSMEYVILAFMVDDMFAESDPWNRYWLKVFCTYVFIQVIANWLCTVCYASDLRETRDNPEMSKLLWDEHPTENGGASVIRVEDVNSDRNGLLWTYCGICKMNKPPRAHHCKICQKCILKRDHHCYFTGTCIGFYNQRNFVILVFYLTVAAFGYFPFCYSYMRQNFVPINGWEDYILPVTIFDWAYKGLEFRYVILMSHFYTVWWGGLMAFGFFCTQLFAIYQGLTPHEIHKKVRIKSTASPLQNFRDVFGVMWLVNFIFPAVIIFRQAGDGKYWTHIKKI